MCMCVYVCVCVCVCVYVCVIKLDARTGDAAQRLLSCLGGEGGGGGGRGVLRRELIMAVMLRTSLVESSWVIRSFRTATLEQEKQH